MYSTIFYVVKNKLVPNQKNLESLTILKEVFTSMEKSNPQISLYVTRHYGSDDIAGFYSVFVRLHLDSVQFRTFRNEK